MNKEDAGEYSANRYNKAEVHRALDERNYQEMDSIQIYQDLLPLIQEGQNYNKYYDYLESFDPHIQTKVSDMPGGIQLSEDGEIGLNTNIAILLDASGSMAQKIGGKVKMEPAKNAINDVIDSMPEGANVTLRVYGHKRNNSDRDKKKSCDSTEVVYDFSPCNQSDFKSDLGKFKQPDGHRLQRPLEKRNRTLKTGEGQNIKYVVSDGIGDIGISPPV